jgi:hypothetical protein
MATPLEHLESFLDSLQDPEPKGFVIDNEGQADWALRKISQSKKRMKELQNVAEEEIHKIETWLLGELAKEEKSIGFFTNLLDVYHWQLYQQDPKRFKSLKLPNGVIKRVKTQPTFERDDEELLRFLEQRNMENLINRTVTPKWGDFKKQLIVSGNVCVLPITGEIVEGVKVIPNEEKFKVEVH